MSPDRPLSILCVHQVPADRGLGAARVHLDLADALEGQGHHVERCFLEDVYRRPSRLRRLRFAAGLDFPLRAARHVRANADRFDVVDAREGALPFSADRLGLRGLLVARSVGLSTMYEEHRTALDATTRPPRGTPVLQELRQARLAHERWKALRSLRAADLVTVPIDAERAHLEERFGWGARTVVLPFGLDAAQHARLTPAAGPRPEPPVIAFVGLWQPRKGALEWPLIVRRTRALLPAARFLFLGTGRPAAQIHAEIGPADAGAVEVVPRFVRDELPAHLARATVAAFPSHLEGFGFAVLETLAAGLPTVAYAAPGIASTVLPEIDRSLLVPLADGAAMAERLAALAGADEATLAPLRRRCREAAGRYRWEQIAADTAAVYRARLAGWGRGSHR